MEIDTPQSPPKGPACAVNGASVQAIIGFLNAAFMAYFASCAILAWHSRLASDDYCWTATAREFGFWGSQAHWLRTWTGRFSFLFTINAIEFAGAWTARIAPTLGLLAWLAALAWAISEFAGALGVRRSRAASWLLAQAIVFSALAGIPNLRRELYWQTGVATYIAPLALSCLLAGMAGRRLRELLSEIDADPVRPPHARPGFALVFGALAFWAAGHAETHATTQAAAFFAAWLACALAPDGSALDRLRPLMRAGLAGTTAGILAIILAPGTAIRLEVEALAGESGGIVAGAWGQSRVFLRRALADAPLALAAPALIGAALGAAIRLGEREESRVAGSRALRRALLWIPLAAGLALLASFVPSGIALPRFPPHRSLFSPQFALACSFAAWGFLAALAWVRPTLGAERPPRILLLLSILLLLWIYAVAAFVAMLFLFPESFAGRGHLLYRILERPQALAAGFLPLWCHFAWLVWLRARLRGERALVLLPALAAIGLGAWVAHGAAQTFRAIPSAAAYARGWDERDRALREAAARGGRSASVGRIENPSGLEDLFDAPWIANAAAGHYGLESISTPDLAAAEGSQEPMAASP